MDVLVLMSTYNGVEYICEQIDSIIAQVGVNVSILIRDDDSSDSTYNQLRKYERSGQIILYKGKNLGPAFSFLDLIEHAFQLPDKYDYYAFADQDDYWEEKKLCSAIDLLSKTASKYNLYTSSLKLVNSKLEYFGEIEAAEFNYPEFLLRNQCAGCTMVFNRNTLNLLNVYHPKYLEMHDVWILRLLSCIEDSKVYYDKNSYILYRQHNSNVVGGSHSLWYSIKLKMKQLFGENKNVYRTALELMKGYEEYLTDASKEFLNLVIASNNSVVKRIQLIKYASGYKFSTYTRKIFFLCNVILNNL